MNTFQTTTETVQIGRHSVQLSDAAESCVRKSVIPEIQSGFFKFEDDKCKTFVDCGANIGIVSLFIAMEHPDWQVIAVEPFPENYRNLCRNIVQNGVTNILPIPLALHSVFDEACSMVTCPQNTGGATNWTVRTASDENHFDGTVVAVTLNSIFERMTGRSKDADVILKMDIEGAEHATLLPFIHWNRLSHLHLESHMNDMLRGKGFSHEKTRENAVMRLSKSASRMFVEIEKGE